MTNVTLVTDVAKGSALGNALQAWADNISVLSNGAHQISVFFPGELVGTFETFDALTSGQVDMAFFTPAFYEASLEGASALTVPFLDALGPNSAAALDVALRSGAIDTQFNVFGISSLAATFSEPYALVTDFDFSDPTLALGSIFFGAGFTSDLVTLLGGNPVNLPLAETFQALSTGVVDGGFLPVSAVDILDLDSITSTAFLGPSDTGFLQLYRSLAINDLAFASFPQDLRTLIEQTTGEMLSRTLGTAEQNGYQTSRASLSPSDYVEELAGTDFEAWNTAGQTVLQNYQSNLSNSAPDYLGSFQSALAMMVGQIADNGPNEITGDATADLLDGLGGNDTLLGNGGNDTLDGGLGVDSLVGGLGDDLFIVDNSADIVRELAGQGDDSVESSVSYNLNAVTQAVEILTLTGSANINGTGNTIDNAINGNSGNNNLIGAAGDDTLNGNAGFDTLIGGIGNDSLDGGTGQDSMSGGDGNDTYHVDNPFDVVREFAGAQSGIDTVFAQISYNLNQQSQNIENLTLTGTAFEAVGNSIANILTGNSSNNRLVGAAGNDTLIGNGGNDTLLGGADDDRLNGGAGVDRNVGGFGNDVYIVDDFNDRVVEFLGEGTDDVLSSVTFSLLFNSNNIENLTLTGTSHVNGSGNNAGNTINGNGGNNVLNGASGFDVLFGGDGNDTLNGGFGEDTLEGGTGDDVMNGGFDAQADTFVFGNSFGDDVIQNYDFGEDIIDLSAVGAITDFADLDANHLTQVGFNAVISDGVNTITILNRDEATFTADDFNFV